MARRPTGQPGGPAHREARIPVTAAARSAADEERLHSRPDPGRCPGPRAPSRAGHRAADRRPTSSAVRSIPNSLRRLPVEQEAGLAALARTADLGMVGAVVLRVEPGPLLGQQLVQPALGGVVGLLVEQAAGDAGLVGHHHDQQAVRRSAGRSPRRRREGGAPAPGHARYPTSSMMVPSRSRKTAGRPAGSLAQGRGHARRPRQARCRARACAGRARPGRSATRATSGGIAQPQAERQPVGAERPGIRAPPGSSGVPRWGTRRRRPRTLPASWSDAAPAGQTAASSRARRSSSGRIQREHPEHRGSAARPARGRRYSASVASSAASVSLSARSARASGLRRQRSTARFVPPGILPEARRAACRR